MISYLPGAWENVPARDQFEAHYGMIWHPHLDAYPADARMTVSYPSGREGQINGKTGRIGPPPLDSSHVDLHDMDSIWDCIERRQAVPAHPPGSTWWQHLGRGRAPDVRARTMAAGGRQVLPPDPRAVG